MMFVVELADVDDSRRTAYLNDLREQQSKLNAARAEERDEDISRYEKRVADLRDMVESKRHREAIARRGTHPWEGLSRPGVGHLLTEERCENCHIGRHIATDPGTELSRFWCSACYSGRDKRGRPTVGLFSHDHWAGDDRHAHSWSSN
jgi:hypothetical protein